MKICLEELVFTQTVKYIFTFREFVSFGNVFKRDKSLLDLRRIMTLVFFFLLIKYIIHA